MASREGGSWVRVRRQEGSEATATSETEVPVGPGAQEGAEGSEARPPQAPDAGAPEVAAISEAEIERRRAALDDLLGLMRPAVQMDGGDLTLVDADVVEGVVEVRLEGACGSCAISSTTLQGGVERLLRERLEWVREVRGGVDDSLDPLESAALGRGAYVPRYE